MMKKIAIYILIAFSALISQAQAKFVQAGKIEYERKINVHRQFDGRGDDSEWIKEYLSKLQKFHTTYFDLYFEGNKTSYKPGRETDDSKKTQNLWGIGPAKENVVAVDLDKKEIKSLKSVFEQTFLVSDTASQFEWKISQETRTIAGFECHKAVTKICDSVYVVAFFTQEITVSGGPESFHGLPGMILGIAIPRLYTTWYATKVELIQPAPSEFTIPTKGKKTDEKQLLLTLKTSFKEWGKDGQRYMWWTLL